MAHRIMWLSIGALMGAGLTELTRRKLTRALRAYYAPNAPIDQAGDIEQALQEFTARLRRASARFTDASSSASATVEATRADSGGKADGTTIRGSRSPRRPVHPRRSSHRIHHRGDDGQSVHRGMPVSRPGGLQPGDENDPLDDF